MKHLMTVQIAYDIKQLTDKLIGVLPLLEIGRLADKTLVERFAVDVFHEDAIVREKDVAHKIWMLQSIADLKFLAKSLLIADIAGKSRLKPFQKMKLAIQLNKESVASGSLHLQGLKRFEM